MITTRWEPVLSGLEARLYVRGGLDPAYADPVDRDLYVRSLLQGRDYELFIYDPPPEHLGSLAAAFLRGWVECRDLARCERVCEYAIDMGVPEYAVSAARQTGGCGNCAHYQDVCRCWVTPMSQWLSAASCGYGSGYEPGSQMEWNPDCPVHRLIP